MVLSMERWIGKVAIVTGASAGIGAAIVKALVEQGLIVVGLARRNERVEELAKQLSNKKGKLYAIKTDISKEEDILKAFKWIKDNLGPVYILINNAGILAETSLINGDTDMWKNTFNVNVVGLCIATREAVKNMKENNVNGHIIHINSVEGHQVSTVPNINVYPASKFAVTALAETLRIELMQNKLKIKITSISPGPVDTEIIPETYKKILEKCIVKKQIIEPENIADAVVYALSTPPHVQIQELTVTSIDDSFRNTLNTSQ